MLVPDIHVNKAFHVLENDVVVFVTCSDEFLEVNFSIHVCIHFIKRAPCKMILVRG